MHFSQSCYNTLCQLAFLPGVSNGFKAPSPSWMHSFKDVLFLESGPGNETPCCILNVTGFVQIKAGPSPTTKERFLYILQPLWIIFCKGITSLMKTALTIKYYCIWTSTILEGKKSVSCITTAHIQFVFNAYIEMICEHKS